MTWWPRRDADAGPGVRPAARAHARALLILGVVNALAAATHLLGYQRAVAAGIGGRVYLTIALAGQLAAAFLAAGALLLPLSRASAGRAALFVVAPATAGLVQAFFFVDRTLFDLMGVHVNRIVLDLAFAQGGLGVMDIPASERWRLGLGAGAVLAAEAALYAWAARRGPGGPPRQWWIRAAAAVVLLLVVERVIYATATLGGPGVGAAAAAAPAFELERLFRLRTAAAETLRYPRGPLELDRAAPRPNLLWIVVESWRRDALDPDLSPSLWRWSRRGLTFRHHVSGGNASAVGVFSQFYGLHGNTVEPLVRGRRGPLLFRVLSDLGYRIGVVASPPLEYAGMRAAIFADVADRVFDAPLGATPAGRDLQCVQRAVEFLAAARPGEPFALVLFLDGTHIPYDFDPERARHRPFASRLGYTDLDRLGDLTPIRNRYLNALADVDRAAGAVLDELERRGLADDTITVVVGDHGEQLGEHGRVGHLLSLSPEETETPLLLRVPGVAPAERTDLSRHVDLPPTVLGVLGVRTPPAEYSLGRSLLRDPAPAYAVLVGPMHRGFRTADGWTVEWETGDVAAHASAGYRVRDPSYRIAPDGAARLGPWVTEALAELQAFSR